jgi:hypothetical protein
MTDGDRPPYRCLIQDGGLPGPHQCPLGAAVLEQRDEPSGLAAVDHPRLDAGGAQRLGQVPVDSRGSPRRAQLGELAHAQAGKRLAAPGRSR